MNAAPGERDGVESTVYLLPTPVRAGSGSAGLWSGHTLSAFLALPGGVFNCPAILHAPVKPALGCGRHDRVPVLPGPALRPSLTPPASVLPGPPPRPSLHQMNTFDQRDARPVRFRQQLPDRDRNRRRLIRIPHRVPGICGSDGYLVEPIHVVQPRPGTGADPRTALAQGPVGDRCRGDAIMDVMATDTKQSAPVRAPGSAPSSWG